MPWTESFAVLNDEHLSSYTSGAAPYQKKALHDLFSHNRLGGSQKSGNLISFSLSPGLQLTKSVQENKSERKIRIPIPRESQIQLVLSSLRLLAASDEEATLRIYLDPAWQDLASDLLANGCEVMLMNHSSPGANPAALWHLLALEETERAVIYVDINSLPEATNYLKRCLLLKDSGLKIWRTPLDRVVGYAPINPFNFGTYQTFPAEELMSAYLWHLQSGIPLLDEEVKWSTAWSNPALGEAFLLTSLYPRAAFDGMLSIIEASDSHSRGLILDVEYATWANPGSEIVFVQPSSNYSPLKDLCEGFLANSMVEKLIHSHISS